MAWKAVGFCIAWIFSLFEGVNCVQCHGCIYLEGMTDSQSSCSTSWPWYREFFGVLAQPPARFCPYACTKIVISDVDNRHVKSVVRGCSYDCDETITSTTHTTCCREDLCNGSTEPKTFINCGCWSLIVTSLITFLNA